LPPTYRAHHLGRSRARCPFDCSDQRFDIDPLRLEMNFKRKQKAVHPDKFGTRTKEEQVRTAPSPAACWRLRCSGRD